MRERTVLIVDDDPTIRELLRDVFEDAGYVVYDGEDGWALGAALKHRPDCILLDLLMPSPWDGWELRRALLDHETTRDIPVVVMTALESAEQWQHDLRAQGLLRKPFALDQAMAAVVAAIEQKGQDHGR